MFIEQLTHPKTRKDDVMGVLYFISSFRHKLLSHGAERKNLNLSTDSLLKVFLLDVVKVARGGSRL